LTAELSPGYYLLTGVVAIIGRFLMPGVSTVSKRTTRLNTPEESAIEHTATLIELPPTILPHSHAIVITLPAIRSLPPTFRRGFGFDYYHDWPALFSRLATIDMTAVAR